MLPNVLDQSALDPFAFRLYAHYVMACGRQHGQFTETVRQTAAATGMSVGQVCNSRRVLAEAGWVVLTPGATPHAQTLVTLANRWAENCVHVVNNDEQTCSPGEQGVHVVNKVVHPVNTSRARVEELTDHFPLKGEVVKDVKDKEIKKEIPKERKEKKRVRLVDDAFRERMAVEFGPRLGSVDEVNDEIDVALAHTAATKYTDHQVYVRNWLKRAAAWHAEDVLGRGWRGGKREQPGVNGYDDRPWHGDPALDLTTRD
jgi:hypothetical protein